MGETMFARRRTGGGSAFKMPEERSCTVSDVREINERHRAFYEVRPYYVVFDERPEGQSPNVRRVNAGFEFDVFGAKEPNEPQPSPDYEQAQAGMRELLDSLSADFGREGCSIELIPHDTEVFLDTRRHFEREGGFTIRVTHTRGLGEPSGPVEDRARAAVEDALHKAGIRPAGAA